MRNVVTKLPFSICLILLAFTLLISPASGEGEEEARSTPTPTRRSYTVRERPTPTKDLYGDYLWRQDRRGRVRATPSPGGFGGGRR